MRTLRLVTLLIMFTDCDGSAQLVIKSPIQEQCISAGLKGCSDIATAATLYADRNAQEGKPKLEQGLMANADKVAELKKFADGLALVGRLPGAGPYVAPLQPAIQLIQKVATESEEQQEKLRQLVPTPRESQANAPGNINSNAKTPQTATHPAVVVAPSQVDLEAPPISTFWLVENDVLASTCRFAGLPQMRCVHEVVDSPYIVTDVMVSSGCPVDVMIASRNGLNFDWLVYAPSGKGADVHSALLPLIPSRLVTVALATTNNKGEFSVFDVRCGVTTIWHAVANQSRPALTRLKERTLATDALPPSTPTTRSTPRAQFTCTPPFTLDSNGVKTFKQDCL